MCAFVEPSRKQKAETLLQTSPLKQKKLDEHSYITVMSSENPAKQHMDNVNLPLSNLRIYEHVFTKH